jgi:hypothetical protein
VTDTAPEIIKRGIFSGFYTPADGVERLNEWKGNPEPLNVEPVNGYIIFCLIWRKDNVTFSGK